MRTVVEQALETVALILGKGKSRGYCLEMICADFLAGARLEENDREYTLPNIKVNEWNAVKLATVQAVGNLE